MTVLPTVRRQVLHAAEQEAHRRAPRRRRAIRRPHVGRVVTAALIAVPILIAGAALLLLSHRQLSHKTDTTGSTTTIRHSVADTASRHVRVQVVQADRYCTSPRGETLERCPVRSRGLIRLGGAHQQWLVMFSFIAPRPTTVHGRTYYYFTADVPGTCPNASQFGEYNANVRTDQRVLLWAAFDKQCPGPGRGTISLITRTTSTSAPGEGASRLLTKFNFTVPPATVPPQIDPVVAALLSVFRRAPTSDDVLPASFGSQLQAEYASEEPVVADARRVNASDGQPAYLVPAKAGVCVINTNEAFCSPAAALPGAEAVDLCSPTLPRGQLEMEWLLPDGATNVAVGMANGAATRFARGFNVYIARFPVSGPLPKTIEWDTGGRPHSVSANVPSDVLNEKCAHPSDLSGSSAPHSAHAGSHTR